MAKTYYDYQRRDPESRINWAEVGKNFTDMLQEEQQVRQDKKAAIDEATRAFQKTLNDTPQGLNKTKNELFLDYANEAQQVLLMQERALKQGYLKPSDYIVQRQNVVDGTDEAFEVMNLYNEGYAETVERQDEGMSSGFEWFEQDQVGKFANFDTTQLVINPETGRVSAATIVDGKVDKSQLRAVSALRNNVQQRYDKYMLQENASAFAEKQGVWDRIGRQIGEQGALKARDIVKDATDKKLTVEQAQELGLNEADREAINLYFEAENLWADGEVENQYKTASILSNYEGYEFTYEPKVAKAEDKILVITNGDGSTTIDFTDEQKEVAKNALKIATRNMMDKQIVKGAVSSGKNYKWEKEQADAESDENNVVNNIAQLWYGNNKQIQEAEDFLRGLNDNIKKIRRTNKGVELYFSDGKTMQPVEFGELSQSQFISSVSGYILGKNAIKDVNQAIARSGIDLNKGRIPNLGDVISERIELPTVDEAFISQLENEVSNPAELFNWEDEGETIDNINSYISGYNLEWDVENYDRKSSFMGVDLKVGDEGVLIKDKNGEELMIIELNKRKDDEWVDNVMDNAPKWMEKINNLIADYTSSDTKKRVVGPITFDSISNTSTPSTSTDVSLDADVILKDQSQ